MDYRKTSERASPLVVIDAHQADPAIQPHRLLRGGRGLLIEELTWKEYSLNVGKCVIVLPVGALDPHGPHMSLDTDTVISHSLAKHLAVQSDVMVLPSIPYGCRSHPVRCGGRFPGATDLRMTTLIDLILDILGSTYEHGGRRFLLLNAHMANVPVMEEAANLFLRNGVDARIMTTSWWDFASEETRDQIARETGVGRSVDHHAGMVESSLMAHLAPKRVRTEHLGDDVCKRRVRYLVLPTPEDLITDSGTVYQASQASAAIGQRLIDEIFRGLSNAVKIELSYDR